MNKLTKIAAVALAALTITAGPAHLAGSDFIL